VLFHFAELSFGIHGRTGLLPAPATKWRFPRIIRKRGKALKFGTARNAGRGLAVLTVTLAILLSSAQVAEIAGLLGLAGEAQIWRSRAIARADPANNGAPCGNISPAKRSSGALICRSS
jgi:hypothetical protein